MRDGVISLSQIKARIKELDEQIETLWSSYELNVEAYAENVIPIDPRRAIKRLERLRAELVNISKGPEGR